MSAQPGTIQAKADAVSVTIERTAAVGDAERCLEEIAAIQQSGRSVELRVAQGLKNDDFGGLLSIVQVIWTWAREDPFGVLHTYFDHAWTRAAVTRAIAENDHVLAAIIASKVVLSNQRADITQFAKSVAETVVARDADEARGARRRAMLMVFESTDQWTSVSRSLYQPAPPRRWLWGAGTALPWNFRADQAPRVKRGSDFSKTISELVDKIVNIRVMKPHPHMFSWLSSAVSELFDNADRWAKTDPLGQPMSPSIRLVRLEFIDEDRLTLARRGEGDRILQSFVARTSPGKRQSYLEIGVLDAGPGVFARRLNSRREDWLRASVELQLAAIRECFIDGWTDDATASGEGRGHGWTNVFVALSRLDGFIRIRTGALALSRDFGAQPLTDGEFGSPEVHDSESGTDVATTHRSVVGTGVTMLIPLDRNPLAS